MKRTILAILAGLLAARPAEAATMFTILGPKDTVDFLAKGPVECRFTQAEYGESSARLDLALNDTSALVLPCKQGSLNIPYGSDLNCSFAPSVPVVGSFYSAFAPITINCIGDVAERSVISP